MDVKEKTYIFKIPYKKRKLRSWDSKRLTTQLKGFIPLTVYTYSNNFTNFSTALSNGQSRGVLCFRIDGECPGRFTDITQWKFYCRQWDLKLETSSFFWYIYVHIYPKICIQINIYYYVHEVVFPFYIGV